MITHFARLRTLWGVAILFAAASALFAAEPAPFTIPGGFSAAGGLSDAGPYAAALVYDVTDPAPPPKAKAPAAKAPKKKTEKAKAPKKANASKKKTAKSKAAAPFVSASTPSTGSTPSTLSTSASLAAFNELAAPRRLVLAVREGGAWKQTEIARARRIDGPVCPGEQTPSPVVAWTEIGLTEWHLCLWRGGETRTIAFSNLMLRNPFVAMAPTGPIIGCEWDRGGEGMVNLYDERGELVYNQPGRHGRLAATRDGVLLLVERVAPGAVTLEAVEIINGKKARSLAIQGPRDYTFNASLAVDSKGVALVAAECATAFGDHCQLGLDRELRAWRIAPGAAKAEPLPAIPVEHRAFKTGMGGSTENTPPIRPRALWIGGAPAVAFREFRCRTNKDFGWDICLTHLGERGWTAPMRLTEQLGPPDTGYALLPDGQGFLGIFPELDNPGKSSKSYAPRVAIISNFPQPGQDGLPMPPIPAAQSGAQWRAAARFTDIAPAPPALKDAPKGLTLIWGDMHAHTAYSKCVPAANGMPDEMLRYERDVLGLQVFSLLEHTNMMGLAECVWNYDRLEAEAGNGAILLYGTEPSVHPGRHTNFFATNRPDFDRLTSLYRAGGHDRAEAWAACLGAFPAGQAVALRHFHGDTAGDDAISQSSFEPRLEVAMEAMQGRGNNLLGDGKKAGFPAIYLNHGFKIGLIGGSDHFRETEALNRYCLTGFWVREATTAGVWEALRNRRTVAVSNGKIAMWAVVAGKGLGEDAAVKGPVRVNVSVAAARPIRRVTLIRDGEVLPWTEVGKTQAMLTLEDKTPAPGAHWYVATAEGDSAYPQAAIAHASPIFVKVE